MVKKFFTKYDRPKQVKLCTGSDSIVDKDSLLSTDINYIVQRYSETGELPVSLNNPIFGDFSKEFTFQEVFDLSSDLRTLYESMPDDKRSELSYNDFVSSLAFDDEEKIGSMFGLQHKPIDTASASADAVSSNETVSSSTSVEDVPEE